MKLKKKTLKRLLFIVMLTITIVNCFSIIFGTTDVLAADELIEKNDIPEGFGTLMSGLTWMITLVPRLCLLIIGFVVQILMNAAVSGASGTWADVTIENILFAGYTPAGGNTTFAGIPLIDINFFNFSGDGAVVSFREAIAKWYYIMRLISASILLVILIYVGIRMALSTIAQEQAKYKQMLVDWVTSLALLFLLHYIIIFIIQVNSSLVSSLGALLTKSAAVSGESVGKHLNDQIVKAIWGEGINGIFAAIIYVAIKGQAFMFFIFYVKRMITVGFLIMIAPLIVITYSIDKMGDGKAQALNTWLKEITYNILIQPFHCVIYLAFFGAISTMLTDTKYGNISTYILALVVLQFMKKAEEILRKIFNFEAHSMGGLHEGGQNLMNATGKFAQMGMAAGKSVSNFKAAGGFKAMKEDYKQFNANRQAKKELKSEFKKDENLQQQYGSYRQYKKSESAQNRLEDIKKTNAKEMKAKADEKRNDKARKIYDKKHGDGAYDKMIEDKAREQYDEKFGKGTYDKVKATAQKKDKNGNPTNAAKKAQNILDGQLSKAREKENGKIISSTKPRKVINGVSQKFSSAADGVKKFTNSRTGKLIGAHIKDSAKVATAIATGSFAFGMTGQANDAISAGQVGYGFAKGVLENSSKTVINGTADLAQKYMESNNMKPEEINQLLNSLKVNKDSGVYDKVSQELKDILNKMTQLGLDKQKAQAIAVEVKSDIAEGGKKLNIGDIFQRVGIEDDIDKEKLEELTKNYSNLHLESMIASQLKQAEGMGMDVDMVSTKIEKKIENNVYNEEINNNYYENHEEVHNNYEYHNTGNETGSNTQTNNP